MVVNATGHLRQHPNEAGGGFEVALLRRRLVEMGLLMEFSSSMCVYYLFGSGCGLSQGMPFFAFYFCDAGIAKISHRSEIAFPPACFQHVSSEYHRPHTRIGHILICVIFVGVLSSFLGFQF